MRSSAALVCSPFRTERRTTPRHVRQSTKPSPESFDFDIYQIFGLHVWLWRNNPSGMFEDFNPKVRCR